MVDVQRGAVVTEAQATVMGPAWKKRGSFQARERANVVLFEIDDSDLVTLPALFHGMKRDVAPIPQEIRLRSLNACIENVLRSCRAGVRRGFP